MKLKLPFSAWNKGVEIPLQTGIILIVNLISEAIWNVTESSAANRRNAKHASTGNGARKPAIRTC